MSFNSFTHWTPAVPFKKPDNIISSEYASLKVFTPSYEKESYIPMEELIAFEYQRIWLSERDEWARKTFPPKNHRFSQRRDSKNIQKNKNGTIKNDGKSSGKTNESTVKNDKTKKVKK
ncbi:hypothetical protein KQX54_013516 [Cotesia glomerata]|uniref:Uncharacterized protein n=1 Tax=Cotesia glomerata TaxID=32391 RepID=A0AAV7J202_COTGL|nr:hypothetical protein KQX54_013516 [Cotesia glomerata]